MALCLQSEYGNFYGGIRRAVSVLLAVGVPWKKKAEILQLFCGRGSGLHSFFISNEGLQSEEQGFPGHS